MPPILKSRSDETLASRLAAIREMKSSLSRLTQDLHWYEQELEAQEASFYRPFDQNARRSAIKRGVIDLKYRLTALVKKLYE